MQSKNVLFHIKHNFKSFTSIHPFILQTALSSTGLREKLYSQQEIKINPILS